VLVGRGYVTIRPEFTGDWDRRIGNQTSRSGAVGGRSFGAAFAKGAASAGLSGLGAVIKSSLAGAGVAAAAVGIQQIGSAALAASAVAVPALSAIGTAGAAIGVGLKGVGKAFKAFDSAAQDAKAAASATRAVESAQRALGRAQQGVAEARTAAARRVQDAERAVVDAQRDATRAQEDLVDAQRDAIDVQQELTSARQDAARQLEDLNARVAEAALDQREAALRVKDAEKDLADARKDNDADAVARAQLALDRAKANVVEQARDQKRLQEDAAKANKAGVEGSEQVVAARERIADANDRVTDAAERAAEADRQVADAQRGVAEAHADGAKQIKDATEAVADAARALADAQSAAASQVSKVDEAMAKLTPNARDFVTTVKELGPAWGEVRKATQESLFAGVADSFRSMSKQIIPDLKSGLSGATSQINAMWRGWMDGVKQLSQDGTLKRFFDGNNKILGNFAKWPAEATKGWVQLSVAATPALDKLTQSIGDASTRLSDRMTKSFESGEMESAISGAVDKLATLKAPLKDIQTIFGNLFDAISGPGTQVLGGIGVALDELARVTSKPEVKESLTSIFTSFASISGTVIKALGRLVEWGLPLLATGLEWVARVLPPVVDWLGRFGAVVVDKIGSGIGAAASGTREFFDAFKSGGDVGTQASALERMGAASRTFSDKAGSYARSFFDAFRDGESKSAWFVAKPGLDGVFDRAGSAARAVGDLLRQQVFPAFVELGQGIQGFLSPILEALGRIWTQHVQHVLENASTVIRDALVPIFRALGEFIRDRVSPALEELGGKLGGLLDALAPVISVIDSLITWFFKVGSVVAGWLVPILLDLAGPIFSFVFDVLGFGIDLIAAVVKSIVWLGESAVWLWREAIVPAFNGIATAVSWTWSNILKPTFSAVGTAFGDLSRWAQDTYHSVADWFGKIGTKIADIAGGIKTSFDNAKKGVSEVWSGVSEVAAAPVRYIVNTVYSDGIRKIWNFVINAVGLGSLALPEAHFAGGGVVPGYAPGVDSVAARLSPGEGVLVPEAVRALGPSWVYGINAHYSKGRRPGGGSQRYAGGGVVGLNGGGMPMGGNWYDPRDWGDDIIDWAKKGLGAAYEGLKQVPGISGVIEWAEKLVRGAAAEAAEKLLRPVAGWAGSGIANAVGAGADKNSSWVRALREAPTALIDKLIGKIRQDDAEQQSFGGGVWLKPADGKYGATFGQPGGMWASGRHTGQDILAAAGSDVRAVAAGQVTAALSGGPYGNHILVNHAGGIQSLYAHLSAMLTRAGEMVAAGQKIGAVGSTGNSTGPHLHLEARSLPRGSFDPMELLNGVPGKVPSGAVSGWIAQALQVLGLGGNAKWAKGLYTIAMRESGGDPRAINLWDSNARQGYDMASKGLMQTIGPTFRSFALPGFGDIWNPVHNAIAAARYIMSRYGDISKVQQADPSKPPKGYSFGGIVPRGGGTHDVGGWLEHGQLGLNMSGKPEAVLTSSDYALLRAAAVANNRANGIGDVHVYVGDREITDIVRVELRDYTGAVVGALGDGRG
jgi:murein DD-endopeptidase MepM/ murein hydrolase activator NlpD/phage-related protein